MTTPLYLPEAIMEGEVTALRRCPAILKVAESVASRPVACLCAPGTHQHGPRETMVSLVEVHPDRLVLRSPKVAPCSYRAVDLGEQWHFCDDDEQAAALVEHLRSNGRTAAVLPVVRQVTA